MEQAQQIGAQALAQLHGRVHQDLGPVQAQPNRTQVQDRGQLTLEFVATLVHRQQLSESYLLHENGFIHPNCARDQE